MFIANPRTDFDLECEGEVVLFRPCSFVTPPKASTQTMPYRIIEHNVNTSHSGCDNGQCRARLLSRASHGFESHRWKLLCQICRQPHSKCFLRAQRVALVHVVQLIDHLGGLGIDDAVVHRSASAGIAKHRQDQLGP